MLGVEDALIRRVARAFQQHDKELYLVGGSVRNTFLGIDAHDLDCATNARPEEIKAIVAETDPLHIIPIGEKFGTIQVHYERPNQPDLPSLVLEITTYRSERYAPGSRQPTVQFGDSLVEDLRRRDFTINAIAQNPLTREIIDPFHGRSDLEGRAIRAVDKPIQRFRDDPLRMLRAVRLAKQLDFWVVHETRVALTICATKLAGISNERIRDEFSKILTGPLVVPALINLLEWGLFGVFLPEIIDLVDVEQLPHHSCDVFDHTTLVVSRVPQRLTVRLAALFHDIAKPLTRSVDASGVTHFYEHEDVGAVMATAILRRLRFGNDIVEHIARVVSLHMRVNSYTEKWSNGAVRRLYFAAGNDATREDLLDLALADGTSDRDEPAHLVRGRLEHLREHWRYVATQHHEQPLVCPLTGDELMEAFGRGPGPWLKPLKQHLHGLVLDGTLAPGDKAAALVAAQSYLCGLASE